MAEVEDPEEAKEMQLLQLPNHLLQAVDLNESSKVEPSTSRHLDRMMRKIKAKATKLDLDRRLMATLLSQRRAKLSRARFASSTKTEVL